jgi:hypothetical protein
MLTWQLILILMLLGHLVADYTLQGWLADGKQKSWWRKIFGGREDAVPDKYKHDYIAALLCHALYWSIFICAPFYASPWFLCAVMGNTIVHAIVDDLKANRMKINLIQDQLLHLIQILITFGILISL